VIAAFLDSWGLFHNVYVSGWLIAALLALSGVVVVARDQIFLGAAVAQLSVLGITLGMRFGPVAGSPHGDSLFGHVINNLCGGLFAVFGSLLTGNRGGVAGESREALTGWLFLVGASMSVLLVAHSPLALAEVQGLLASTLLGATHADVVGAALLLAVGAATVLVRRDTILLLVMDAEMARAVGTDVRGWNRALAVWLGVTIAFAIHVSGVIYTFGCLVLPALVAKHLCREVGRMFVVAPLVALVNAGAAFVLANGLDYPPAQLAVASLAALVVVAWLYRVTRSALR
jgi:ABC-type Mn2+/Zn2+ transport system permease subunit